MELTVDCTPMHAKLTEHGCQLNQDLAKRAYRMLQLTRNAKFFMFLDDIGLDRLDYCGKCPRCNLDQKLLQETIDRNLKILKKAIEEWEEHWFDGDPELSALRRQESVKKYNDAHAEQRAEYMRNYRRLKKLNQTNPPDK